MCFSRKAHTGEGLLLEAVIDVETTKRGGNFSPWKVTSGGLIYCCPFNYHGLDFTGAMTFISYISLLAFPLYG